MIPTLFSLIFLSAFIALTVGLIKPQIFKPLLKEKTNRKIIFAIFGGTMFVSIMIVGATAPPIEETAPAAQDEAKITEQTEQLTVEQPKAIYSIKNEEDVSYASVNRYSVDIVITSRPVTENQIKTITEEITGTYQKKGSNATTVFFYTHDAEVGYGYTLARAVWAPNGEWSDAELKTNYVIKYDFKNKVGQDWPNEPTDKEQEIVRQINESDPVLSDEETYIALSSKLGLSIEELTELHYKVIEFQLK